MPFNGLTLFLQEVGQTALVFKMKCQCPLTGFIHFYCENHILMAKEDMYQCPLTGFIHFYPATWEVPVYKALKGAFSTRFF